MTTHVPGFAPAPKAWVMFFAGAISALTLEFIAIAVLIAANSWQAGPIVLPFPVFPREATQTPSPSPTATRTPTPTLTLTPTVTPTATRAATPTPTPTSTLAPTATPITGVWPDVLHLIASQVCYWDVDGKDYTTIGPDALRKAGYEPGLGFSEPDERRGGYKVCWLYIDKLSSGSGGDMKVVFPIENSDGKMGVIVYCFSFPVKGSKEVVQVSCP